MEGPPPTLQFSVQSKIGLQTFRGAKEPTIHTTTPNVELFQYSKDGTLLVRVANDTGIISVVNTSTEEVCVTMQPPRVIAALHISPCNSFLLTWHHRPRAEQEANSKEGNLILWNMSTGAIVWKELQKHLNRSAWPTIRWTDDEHYSGRLRNNHVHIFAGNDPGGRVVHKVNVPNLASFAFAPGPPINQKERAKYKYKVATFVPTKKAQPAWIGIFDVDEDVSEPKARKAFFRGNEVDFVWNPQGSALLVRCKSDVDATGKSYYGKVDLHFLRADGSGDFTVQPGRDGGIHDVQWHPRGKKFVVLYGSMPASATIYTWAGKVFKDLGQASHNTAVFSPGGHLLALAGFGSLRGEIAVYDSKDGRKVGLCTSYLAGKLSWAPNSRYFITAVLSRMKVDNGFKVFSYDGTLVHEQAVDTIGDVQWAPQDPFSHPPMVISPRVYKLVAEREQAAEAAKPKKYRPPGRSGGGSSVSAMLADLRSAGSGPRSFSKSESSTTASSGSPVRKPVGMTGRTPVGLTAVVPEKPRRRKKGGKKDSQGPAAPSAQAKAKAQAASIEDPDELKRRLKRLRKKLRQIADLKEGVKGGKVINEAQEAKIASEAETKALIAQFEAELAKLTQ